MHRKTFRYRLYPTPAQQRALQQTLGECRWLYNRLLEVRRAYYQQTGKSVSLYSQINQIPEIKRGRRELGLVHSQVLQNVAVRVDLAFRAFFRRVKRGEKPGYPRFRGAGRYVSFAYPQGGFRIEHKRVFLSKIGHVRAVIHRPLEGKVKTAAIRRNAAGEWHVCFSCEVEPKPLPGSSEQVGIDVGLNSFATLSSEKMGNPRFFRNEEKALSRAQRRLEIAEKGTKERARRRRVVARIHERIANKRHNFAHQASRRMVNRFGFIAVEDLSVARMNKNHWLAKSIMDAAWGEFTRKLSYKAEWAGRRLVKVDPAFTSQDCSCCEFRQVMPLSERIYRCGDCGLELDRDHNAAMNILRVGLHSQGGKTAQEAVALQPTE